MILLVRTNILLLLYGKVGRIKIIVILLVSQSTMNIFFATLNSAEIVFFGERSEKSSYIKTQIMIHGDYGQAPIWSVLQPLMLVPIYTMI